MQFKYDGEILKAIFGPNDLSISANISSDQQKLTGTES
jgi:hypothetical protein